MPRTRPIAFHRDHQRAEHSVLHLDGAAQGQPHAAQAGRRAILRLAAAEVRQPREAGRRPGADTRPSTASPATAFRRSANTSTRTTSCRWATPGTGTPATRTARRHSASGGCWIRCSSFTSLQNEFYARYVAGDPRGRLPGRNPRPPIGRPAVLSAISTICTPMRWSARSIGTTTSAAATEAASTMRRCSACPAPACSVPGCSRLPIGPSCSRSGFT